MNKLILTTLGAFAAIALGGLALAQGQGILGNFPLVGGSSYCVSTVNGVCQQTIPAGPSSVTGNETFVANTNLSQGRSPQTVLMKPAALNANPITFQTVTPGPAVAGATNISASNINGGIIYSSTGTITSAAITLPSNAMHGQQYAVSSNRTITTLNIGAASGDSIDTNTNPTALTASTTANQGYRFICDKTSDVCVWKRLQ